MHLPSLCITTTTYFKSTIASTKAKLGVFKAKKRKKIMKTTSKAQQSSSACETLQQVVEDTAAENAAATLDDIDSSNAKHLLLPARLDLSIDSFELGSQLGSGKFGHVFLSRHRTSNYICALKLLHKAQITSGEEENLIRRELEVHQNLAHANILRFLSWFHDTTRIYLVLEYAPGGSLYERLLQQPKGRFNEHIAAQYIAQLAGALQYMHSKSVMHRDIKPENILLGLHNEIKLADFGYAMHSVSGSRSTVCGTLDYISPEVAALMLKPGSNKNRYTQAVDRWSLGVLTFEFVVGKPPFRRKSTRATQKKIAGFKGGIKVPGHVSLPAEDFILGLLNLDAGGRLELDDVLTHPWIEGHCENSAQSGLRSCGRVVERAGAG